MPASRADDGQKAAARARRGQADPGAAQAVRSLGDAALIRQLDDADPQQRSAAAQELGRRTCLQAVEPLCARLCRETALYARLSICAALEGIGLPAVPALAARLGRIGRNQHERLPTAGFYKKSYPLPRDLAARTLGRIGPPAAPALEAVLHGGERRAVCEALDACGWIAAHHPGAVALDALLAVVRQSPGDELIAWKTLRALQAFAQPAAWALLAEAALHAPQPALRWEAVRSLSLNGGVTNAVRQAADHDPHPEVRAVARHFMPLPPSSTGATG